MDENENFDTEFAQPEVGSSLKKQFTTVTPLSKYLAMALFIAMPFLGLWVGLNFQGDVAPLIHEIEKDKMGIVQIQDINASTTKTSDNKRVVGEIVIEGQQMYKDGVSIPVVAYSEVDGVKKTTRTIDLLSLEHLHTDYYGDKDAVYVLYGNKFELYILTRGYGPFGFLGEYGDGRLFWRDTNSVYHGRERIRNSDPDSFVFVGEIEHGYGYYKDKDRVYHLDDSRGVGKEIVIMYGADSGTFNLIDGSSIYDAEDFYFNYKNGLPIHKTFDIVDWNKITSANDFSIKATKTGTTVSVFAESKNLNLVNFIFKYEESVPRDNSGNYWRGLDASAVLSPDKKFIAYAAVLGIYTYDLEAESSNIIIAHDSLYLPTWSADGKYLLAEEALYEGMFFELIDVDNKVSKTILRGRAQEKWHPTKPILVFASSADGYAAPAGLYVVDLRDVASIQNVEAIDISTRIQNKTVKYFFDAEFTDNGESIVIYYHKDWQDYDKPTNKGVVNLDGSGFQVLELNTR